MLNVIFNEPEDLIYNTDVYFDNVYEDKWLTDDFAKRLIKSVDKSTVVSGQSINSPYLGVISPEKLSGGVKTVILLKNCKGEIFNASTCGNNCAPFILEIAAKEDITIYLEHLMNFGKKHFDIRIINEDVVVHNMKEFFKYAYKYV